MSLLRQLVDAISLKNMIFVMKTTGVRGPTLARLDIVLVLLYELLLFKPGNLCFTSHLLESKIRTSNGRKIFSPELLFTD